MKKLKLELDHVRVESFETTAALEAKGTVVGHITAAVSCRDSACCTPDYACPQTYYTGPCECGTGEFSAAAYPTCEYSCIYDACN
ncbi:MAG TPA: hypothetical protein VM890_13945 [Longimicrobium sp.]|nr:hypothetical protein [Longimicrobium sp.]